MWTVVNPAFHGHQNGWWKLCQDQTLSLYWACENQKGRSSWHSRDAKRPRVGHVRERRSCNADILCLFLGLMSCLCRSHVCTAREWVSEWARERERGQVVQRKLQSMSLPWNTLLHGLSWEGNPPEHSRCQRQKSDTSQDDDKLKLHGNDADMSITLCLEWE